MEGIVRWRTSRSASVSPPEPAGLPDAFEASGPAVPREAVVPSQGAGPDDFEPLHATSAARRVDIRRIRVDDAGTDGFAVAGLRP